MTINNLSLFSGIGGLDLGLERAGFTTVGQVERDPFCKKILAARWPEVPRHDNVETAGQWWAGAARPTVHVLSGGFPCQPHSLAGNRRGTADERWGWDVFRDVIESVRPGQILIENVPGLLGSGAERVLRDLATLRYDAWWGCIPAAAVGAPHLRQRLLILASREPVGAEPIGPFGRNEPPAWLGANPWDGRIWAVADPHVNPAHAQLERDHPREGDAEDATRRTESQRNGSSVHLGSWSVEPDVDRVAHGIPDGLDRMRVLGNAVVPAWGEYAGQLLMSLHLNASAHKQTSACDLVAA